MRTTRCFTYLLASCCLFAPAAYGSLINGGFEDGDFTGWSVAGDALVVTSAIGAVPTEGTFQALLTTASELGDDNTFSGTGAVLAADLEAFLGLTAGTLAPGFEGSAIRQTFDANAGDVLTFRYKFLTTEGLNADFAFATLVDHQILADTQAADLTASDVVLDPIFGDPTLETDWRIFTHTFATSGTFTLGIGVVDASDEFAPSGLLIDDARLRSAGVIPEPATLLLLGTGLASLPLLARRRQRTIQAQPRRP